MEPLDGEIWEDAEGVLLVRQKDAGWWAFGAERLVPDDDPIIAHPLRLVFDAHGYLQVGEGFRLRYPNGRNHDPGAVAAAQARRQESS